MKCVVEFAIFSCVKPALGPKIALSHPNSPRVPTSAKFLNTARGKKRKLKRKNKTKRKKICVQRDIRVEADEV